MASVYAASQDADSTIEPIERETIACVRRRLIPLLFICYYAAYLDRVNVGFGALQMNKALGFSATVFGLGSGIFFVGYFLFEIPSNLILAKVGARRWIARILLTWGIISALNAFVWDSTSFYGVRFLLGLAEAGDYPGIILFLTWWFPARYRARMIAQFMTAIPVAVVTGSIVSGYLLQLGLRLPAAARRVPRLARLAVAVPDRGGAGDRAQRGGLFLPHRQTGGRALAAAGATRMAEPAARRRAVAARVDPQLRVGRDLAQRPRLGADTNLFRPERHRLWPGAVPAADRQALRPEQRANRLRYRPALPVRHWRTDSVGHVFRSHRPAQRALRHRLPGQRGRADLVSGAG